MALDQAANFVRGSLTAAVGPADTTFEVANASQYPDPSTRQYNLVVWDADNHARPDQDGNVEIVRVSARDTTADELTVTRGQESTSGASHPNGAAVQLSPTAKVVEDVNTRTSALSDDGQTFDGESVTTEGTHTRTLNDEVTGADFLGLDPSLTHGKWVSLTIDQVFSVPWISDHRNPVEAEGISYSHNEKSDGVVEGHIIGDPDPVVINDNLHIYGEGNNSAPGVEDIHTQTFEDDGLRAKTPVRYIGNNDADNQRVAPVVRYVPERDTPSVMFHAHNAVNDSWDRNFGISESTNLLEGDWSRFVDPLIEDVSPHFGVVRHGDTIYVFIEDRKESSQSGYYTLDVNDLTTLTSSYQPIDLPNRQYGFTPTLTRCRDGYILINCNWDDVEVWETTFEDFPHGWTNRRVNPFGFEKAESWSVEGHRNVSICEVNGVPMAFVPGTTGTGGAGTPNSQNGFYRVNRNSKLEWESQRLPEGLYPAADIRRSVASTNWVSLNDPNGNGYQATMQMDPVSASEVYFQGSWGVLFDSSDNNYEVKVRLYDTENDQELIRYSSNDPSFRVFNEGPFDISSDSGFLGTVKLRLQGKVTNTDAELGFQPVNRAPLHIRYPIGRLPE